MYLSKELLLTSCVVLVLAILIGRGSTVQNAFSGPLSATLWEKETEPAWTPPKRTATSFQSQSMVMLLLRLQEIQTQIDVEEDPRADALSEALFELSLEIRETFANDLFVAYEHLSAGHQIAFRKVAKIVVDLDHMMASSSYVSDAVAL